MAAVPTGHQLIILPRAAHPKQWHAKLDSAITVCYCAKSATPPIENRLPDINVNLIRPSENLPTDYYCQAEALATNYYQQLCETAQRAPVIFKQLDDNHPLNDKAGQLLQRYWLLESIHTELSHLHTAKKHLNNGATAITVITETLDERAIQQILNSASVTVIYQQSSAARHDKQHAKKQQQWWQILLPRPQKTSALTPLPKANNWLIDTSKQLDSVHAKKYLIPIAKQLLSNGATVGYLLLDEQTTRGRSETALHKLIAPNKNPSLTVHSLGGLERCDNQPSSTVFTDAPVILPKDSQTQLANLWALARRFSHLGNVLYSAFSNQPNASITGMSDRIALSLIHCCRQWDALTSNTALTTGKVNTIQFGIANRTFSLGNLSVDNLLVTDRYAKQVYSEQGVTAVMPITGSPEWAVPNAKPKPLINKEDGNIHIGFFHQPLYNGASEERKHYFDAIDNALNQWVKASATHTLWIKPHYRETAEQLTERFGGHQGIHILNPNDDNEPLLATIDIAISYYSAVLGTAMAWGIPSIAVLHLPACQPFYDCLTHYGGGLITQPTELTDWLNTYECDEHFRKDTHAKAQQFKQELATPDPIAQIAKLINS
jgi:hypothetical protein